MRFAALWALLLAGCVIPPLSDKACPCADGFRCDPARQVCVPRAADEGAIQVDALGVAWVTPQQMRWTWTSTGDPEQLRAYELVVATRAEDLSSRSGSAVVWTVAENPELGRYYLPRTDGQSPVRATTTDGLQPSTLYFGQLSAIDVRGKISLSNVASQRTADPPLSSVEIFEDEDTAGYSIPSNMVRSTDRPYRGSHDYRLVSSCDNGVAACFMYLRRQGLNLSLAAIPEGSFTTGAYLEVAVAYEGAVPSYFSAVRLWFGESDPMRLYYFNAWTARADGRWRLIQVPLRALRDSQDEGTLQYSELSRGLFELAVGGLWSDGATVRIDAIRIYY